MTLVVATFVLTLTVTLGSYWWWVLRPEAAAAGRLRQRLYVRTEQPAGAPSVVRAATSKARTAGFIGAVRDWHRRYAVTAAARLLESAGMRTDPHWLVGGTALTLIVVVITLRVVQANWLTSLVAGAMTPLVPYFYIRYAAQKRLHAFEERFPDALSLMARALRGGHALISTLGIVVEEVPEPVKSEFRAIYEQHNFGLPLPQVLRTFARRIPLVDARFFATAVLTQRETGGNLAEVLDNLARVMRDRSRVRRQMRVLTAQARMTGWVLGALPVVMGVIMYVVDPGQMIEFVTDPLGWRLLELAVFLELAGVFFIRQIVDVSY
jgi:tight adherence protein B